MKLARLVTLAAFSTSLAVFTGCGNNNDNTTTTSGPTPASLSGNWLLSGQLPIFVSTGSSANGLAATLDVNGSAVSGIVSLEYTCTASGINGPVTQEAPVTGTVSSGGSFVLQTPTGSGNVPLSVTIEGSIPTRAGASWTGNFIYNASTSICSSGNIGSGNITATAIPLLNGTWSGSVTQLLNSTALTASVALKQGGSINASGATVTSNLPLSGTLTIRGSSCLTTGTANGISSSLTSGFGTTAAAGAVEGNTLIESFTMNDGSVVALEGSIAATDASKLVVAFVTLTPGSCNSNFTTTTATLTKQ